MHDWTNEIGTIMFSKFENNQWTKPRAVSCSEDYWDDSPVFSPDGKRLYFHSGRPLKGYEHLNMWFVEKMRIGWDEPKKMSLPVNPGTGASFTKDGTICFALSEDTPRYLEDFPDRSVEQKPCRGTGPNRKNSLLCSFPGSASRIFEIHAMGDNPLYEKKRFFLYSWPLLPVD